MCNIIILKINKFDFIILFLFIVIIVVKINIIEIMEINGMVWFVCLIIFLNNVCIISFKKIGKSIIFNMDKNIVDVLIFNYWLVRM